jgi:hypothetical protein
MDMSIEMLENVEKIRRGFEVGSRVGVSQLGRSTQWRSDLERLSALEVLDRNQTAGILLSPSVYKSLLEYLDNMDKALEQAQVEQLFDYRKEMHWTSGEDLATKAKTSLKARQEHIRGLLDGDQ